MKEELQEENEGRGGGGAGREGVAGDKKEEDLEEEKEVGQE